MKLKPEIHREWTEQEKLRPGWIPEDLYMRYVNDCEDALDIGIYGDDLPRHGDYSPGRRYYRQSPDFTGYEFPVRDAESDD